jgi:hypothetical protein
MAPFDGNGTFTRLMNWTQDAATPIKIKADRHDINDDDIASGLSNCVTRDGQSSPTGNIPMNSKKIVNLGPPTADTDAATKAYVDAVKTFKTGLVISGADVNGQLNFSSATGANGLTFTGSDLSWLARLATAAGPGTPPVPPATLNRLVLNDKPDGSGTDVVTINDNGTIVATGTITATPTLIAKATTGNVHTWYKGPKDEDRMVMYTAAASYGHGFLRINGDDPATGAKKPVYTFQNDGIFKAPSTVFAGNGSLQTDGNITASTASIWANFSGSHNDAYTAINAQIEARARFWVSQIYMQRSGSTYSGNVGDTNGWICPAGTVIIGYARAAGTSGPVYGLYYTSLQIYDPVNGWRTMGG